MFSVLRKVVSVLVPRRLPTAFDGLLYQSQIHLAEVPHVHIGPQCLSFTNLEARAFRKGALCQNRRLNAALISWTAARPVDCWRTDDCCLDPLLPACTGRKHNLVDLSMGSEVGQRDDFRYAIPVVIYLGRRFTIYLTLRVCVGDDGRSRGMDPESRRRRGPFGYASGYGFCGAFVVCIGSIYDSGLVSNAVI